MLGRCGKRATSQAAERCTSPPLKWVTRFVYIYDSWIFFFIGSQSLLCIHPRCLLFGCKFFSFPSLYISSPSRCIVLMNIISGGPSQRGVAARGPHSQRPATCSSARPGRLVYCHSNGLAWLHDSIRAFRRALVVVVVIVVVFTRGAGGTISAYHNNWITTTDASGLRWVGPWSVRQRSVVFLAHGGAAKEPRSRAQGDDDGGGGGINLKWRKWGNCKREANERERVKRHVDFAGLL